jgi:very-short-patch-repair endonuclease
MTHQILPSSAWELTRKQHGVVTRAQLLQLGFSPDAIKHRIWTRRLHPVAVGVYAVGRAELDKYGRWMAAVLSCGPGAVLSHESAAALWEIRWERRGPIEVVVPRHRFVRRPGVKVHRRSNLTRRDVTRHHGIPVTSPICTIVDLVPRLQRIAVEGMISEADSRGLVRADTVRPALEKMPSRPGLAALKRLLDRLDFVLTDSDLERLFLPIARRAGLPKPITRRKVNSFRIDFYWPDLGLVVECDSLRYHRTQQKQTRDVLRDQIHHADGLIPLRFTHAQIAFEPKHVQSILDAVVRRLPVARRAA